MREQHPIFRAIVLVVFVTTPLHARAEVPSTTTNTEAAPLALETVLHEAMAHNHALKAAFFDVEQARASVRAERTRYTPSLIVDGTATQLNTPQLRSTGGTTTSSQQGLVLGAEVRETLPWGTALSLRVEGDETTTASPFGTGSPQVVRVGPGYGLTGRLSLTQPLLRGFGRNIGEAELRQALFAQEGQTRARLAVASEVLRDVVSAFWELWYAQRAHAIESAARALAGEQLDEARRRVRAGAAAPVVVLTHESRLAELETSVIAAETLVRQRAFTLERLLGRAALSGELLRVVSGGPPRTEVPTVAMVRTQAREASYDVARLAVSLAQAQDRMKTAGEQTRPRLDVQGFVQTRGLGNDELAPVAEQLATFDHVSTNVAIVGELPLWWERNDAQRRAAEFAARAAEERVENARALAEAAAAGEHVSLDAALRRVELSAHMARVAALSVEAQRKRYAGGAAILLEVYEAEDQLRRAQLSELRARVDAAIADVRLAHLTASLLPRYSDVGLASSE